MRNFITRITLPHGNPEDQSSLHTALSSDRSLLVELTSLRHKGAGLEIEFRTSGAHSISDLGRTIAGAVDIIKKPSSFFIIREKKS